MCSLHITQTDIVSNEYSGHTICKKAPPPPFILIPAYSANCVNHSLTNSY